MAEAGVLAYPVIMAAMIAVARIGRKEAWGELEWLRLGALAGLLGAATAVQVKLAMLGAMHSPVGFVAGFVSLAGMCAWCGLYLWQHWRPTTRAVAAPEGIRA